MRRILRVDFVRFCLVGGAGFALNFIVLELLYRHLGLPLIISQLVAAEIALAHNFAWHHHWTYKHHKVQKSLGTLVWQFHATSWVAVVGSALLISSLIEGIGLDYLPALFVTAVAAMIWNFSWSKYVIWRRRNQTDNDGEIGLL